MTVNLTADHRHITGDVAALAGGEDGVERVHAEHAHVGDGEVAAGVVRGRQPGAARLLHEPGPHAAELVHVRTRVSGSTGVMSPDSSATAMAMFTFSLYTMEP